MLGLLSPLLNISELIRNVALLYKQLIRPMVDYACLAWRSAALSYVRRLQVMQSKRLRFVTDASWYRSNRQIHEDLGVPLLSDITALTATFNSKVLEVGNTQVWQLGRYLH
jgi:hypothetical protein